jgi:hypothetical protein
MVGQSDELKIVMQRGQEKLRGRITSYTNGLKD